MADRFVVVWREDLPEDKQEMVPEDCSALVDTLTGDVVGSDGGEPEDRYFSRDWSWVPREMNRLAAELERVTFALARVVDVVTEEASKVLGERNAG